ncbi:VC0807 family protein [Nocardia sp. CDC160]|uniref:VC0807 family protein n=1 Tax=Nocardia sp. CDC160 TaxID=3112166 RepID=UPI002DBC586B|nr:VC0807 family protein [Nocardia sp. CDC160]MEC3918344.1 VC0807 family protein [Nocardia sp. CDC160]
MSQPATPAQTVPTDAQKRAALRKHIARQLLLELILPLGAYYGLRAAGVNPWAALVAPALLTLGFLAYDGLRHRRVDGVALFTLLMIVVGTAVSVVTGDPRTLLVRDSWLFGAIGVWILATLFTQRPMMRSVARTIVTVKIGEAGYREWDARWDNDSRFRHNLRVLSAVWGAGFALDAVIRIVVAYSLPLDAIPLVTTLQWLAVLAVLISFHIVYVNRNGLKV